MSPDAQERVLKAAVRVTRVLVKDCANDAEILSTLCLVISNVLAVRQFQTDTLSWIGHLCFALVDRAEQVDDEPEDRSRANGHSPTG
jgi:hypothetical protein